MRSFTLAAAASLSLACLQPLGAQVATKKILTLEGAKKAAAAAEAEAKKRNLGCVIVVVDDEGELLFLERLDNTQVGSIAVGIGKARTAGRFRRPTRDFEEQVKNGRLATLVLPDATPLEGAVPILSDGVFVGAIGVSGDTPRIDAEIAMAGAAAIR